MLNDPAAYYMQLGREQERECIIKLLKEYVWIDMQSSELIGLITGEQK
jgi:hypothetical protein